MPGPTVTFAIANYNGDRFLRAAVSSALAQRAIEADIVIVDDRSTDASWALAQELAAGNERIRAFRLPDNGGPAGARNLAIDEARGDWLAVLDNDDLIHPERTRRLIEEADISGATMIADDLLLFDDAGIARPSLFLSPQRAGGPHWIDLPGYLRETVMYGRHPNLGFLKPVIRLGFLRAHKIRYDQGLRIAEDDDLVIRALMAGARYRLLPRPMYFYRKHGTSISHRLSCADADRMMVAENRRRGVIADHGPAAVAALGMRQRALRRAWGFSHLVDAIKRRDARGVLAVVRTTPASLLLLRQPILAVIGRAIRRGSRAARHATDPRSVLFVSRQRLAGATNGSSAYLIALAEAARAAGLVPHLLQPSPLLFGRTPIFRLRPEMEVFETIRIRSAVRLGNRMITRDPAVFAGAARGVLARLLRRIGIGGPLSIDRKAPYAIAAPWSREDVRFVAEHGRGVAPIAIADYIFQTEALPYLLDPALRSAVVMHDLFSARADQFGSEAADSVAAIDEAGEIDMLGRADAVIAIQATEAAFVAARVPGVAAILAPMAARPVSAAQPGDPRVLLFVGSNTAPNIHGLAWFVDAVWPTVHGAAPDTRLIVAGTVAAGFAAAAPGVEMRGLVDDLAPLYAEAGVVISPLRQGSGLKIKLIEALARGKACVVTGVTLQGVETLLGDAVVRADDAGAFAAAIQRLQRDDAERTALAEAALAAATDHFGPDAAFRDVRAWLSAAVSD